MKLPRLSSLVLGTLTLLLSISGFSSGSASAWERPVPAVHPEYDGLIVTTHIGRGMWIEIVMDGKKRLIQDALQYHALFDGCLKVDPDLYNSIERGPYLSRDAQLIQDRETAEYYLVETGSKRLLRNPVKYCFKLSAAEGKDHKEILALPDGGPEIL